MSVLVEPSGPAVGQRPDESCLRAMRDLILGNSSVHTYGLLLYGSCARGTQTARSDVDIIQVVDVARPKPWSLGKYNINQYLPQHIGQMLSGGSLFGLHLRSEGLVLHDHQGLLARGLAQQPEPPKHEALRKALALAAAALAPATADRTLHLPALARLGCYALRTSAYSRAVEAGFKSFDMGRVADFLGDSELVSLVNLARDVELEVAHLDLLVEALPRYTGPLPANRSGSVAGCAVSASHEPLAAALLGQVLAGRGRVDYGDIADFAL